MANSGPNPVLMVRDHLPEHVAGLREDLAKAVARVREIQAELIEAQTYLAVAQEKPQDATSHEQRSPRGTRQEAKNDATLPSA